MAASGIIKFSRDESATSKCQRLLRGLKSNGEPNEESFDAKDPMRVIPVLNERHRGVPGPTSDGQVNVNDVSYVSTAGGHESVHWTLRCIYPERLGDGNIELIRRGARID